MHKCSGTSLPCRPRDQPSPFRMHRIQGLFSGWLKDSDEVDGRVRPFQSALDLILIAQIGLNGMDLTDTALRLEMDRVIRPAHGNPNAAARLCQRLYNVAPQKSGTAENCNQSRAVE